MFEENSNYLVKYQIVVRHTLLLPSKRQQLAYYVSWHNHVIHYCTIHDPSCVYLWISFLNNMFPSTNFFSTRCLLILQFNFSLAHHAYQPRLQLPHHQHNHIHLFTMQYSHLLQNFLVSIEEKKKGRGGNFCFIPHTTWTLCWCKHSLVSKFYFHPHQFRWDFLAFHHTLSYSFPSYPFFHTWPEFRWEKFAGPQCYNWHLVSYILLMKLMIKYILLYASLNHLLNVLLEMPIRVTNPIPLLNLFSAFTVHDPCYAPTYILSPLFPQ